MPYKVSLINNCLEIFGAFPDTYFLTTETFSLYFEFKKKVLAIVDASNPVGYNPYGTLTFTS